MLLRLALLVSIALLTGCSTVETVSFRVTSSPPNCPVEVNDVYKGDTPVDIKLPVEKRWTGLMTGIDGYTYFSPTYKITCLPPVNSTEQLESSTKIIHPVENMSGGQLFYNLKLTQVTPVKRIEIR